MDEQHQLEVLFPAADSRSSGFLAAYIAETSTTISSHASSDEWAQQKPRGDRRGGAIQYPVQAGLVLLEFDAAPLFKFKKIIEEHNIRIFSAKFDFREETHTNSSNLPSQRLNLERLD